MADAVSHCMARYFVLTCSVPLVTSGVGALMIAVVPLLTRQGMLVGALMIAVVPLLTRQGMLVGALMIAVVPLLTRQGMLVGALTAGRCPDDRCSVPLVTRLGMMVDDLMIGALSHWLLVTVCW